MSHLASLTALAGVVIGMGAYTGNVLGAVLGAWLRGKLYGDQ
ncbi:hypothetical protein QA860_08280 [Streptomyces stelliscabiei]